MGAVSLRAYAKHRGVTLKAVQKAIESGRIHPNADGKIDTDRSDADMGAQYRPEGEANRGWAASGYSATGPAARRIASIRRTRLRDGARHHCELRGAPRQTRLRRAHQEAGQVR